MRSSLVLSALAGAAIAAGACAPATTGAEPTDRVRSTTLIDTDLFSTVQLTTYRDAGVVRHEIPLPVERVWTVLPQVFNDLGVEISTIDPATRTIGNRRLQTGNRLAGETLNRLISCGSGPMVGSAPAIGRATLSVVSTLRADPNGGTHLETRVEGTARGREGTSTAAQQCTSTGRLENQIANRVVHALTLAPGGS